jgi:hypothetical protein
MLEKEINYLQKNKEQLIQQYGAKYLLIKGEEVGGAFDTLTDALQGAAFAYGTENVLIRRAADAELEVSIPALTLGILNANISHPTGGTGENTGR